MKQSLLDKLQRLTERQEELHALLSSAEVSGDQNRLRELGKELAGIRPVVACFHARRANLESIQGTRQLLDDEDAAIRQLARDELSQAEEEGERLETELHRLLLPQDPADNSNIFLEIRAGTGGQEAALFAADLMRMYSRYAEANGWRVEIMSRTASELDGFKEVILRIIGAGAYSKLKFESGAHRVQRVPATESQGRIHTSACTVAVLPEADAIDAITINAADVRVDTYRASGAGGQHVNKTDSAVRLTHAPSGIVVECQDERSQHKNRARAMSLLQAKLLAAEQERQAADIAESRRHLVGSGDRSERIRTYNFPQGRMTDHRINLTLYRLEELMQGDLDLVIAPLNDEYQAEQLAALALSDQHD